MTSSQASATTVAVAASTVPAEFLVPDLVRGFSLDHPEYAVEVTTTDSAGVFAALRDGTAEIGFAGTEPDGGDLVATGVGTDEVVLAVPAGHDLARSGTASAADLGGAVLVEREEGSGTRREFVDALAERGTPVLAGRREIRDSGVGVLDAVRDGVGIGVVSARVLSEHGGDDVVAVRVGEPVERSLFLVRREDAVLGPAASAFLTRALGTD